MSLFACYLRGTHKLYDFLAVHGSDPIREVDPKSIPLSHEYTFVDILSEVIASYYPDLELVNLWIDKFPKYKTMIMRNVLMEYDLGDRSVTRDLIDTYITHNIVPDISLCSVPFKAELVKKYEEIATRR